LKKQAAAQCIMNEPERTEDDVKKDGVDELLQRPSILVVDDDPDVLEALTETLSGEGYTVRGARDGLEALRAIAQSRPDLIITDLMMPTMTGFELLGTLHENPELASIPTLIITAVRSQDQRTTAAPIFQKPIDLDGLLRAIGAFTATPSRGRGN
jgi:two-component system, chemotaxis family, chemotaxis protein CheY